MSSFIFRMHRGNLLGEIRFIFNGSADDAFRIRRRMNRLLSYRRDKRLKKAYDKYLADKYCQNSYNTEMRAKCFDIFSESEMSLIDTMFPVIVIKEYDDFVRTIENPFGDSIDKHYEIQRIKTLL